MLIQEIYNIWCIEEIHCGAEINSVCNKPVFLPKGSLNNKKASHTSPTMPIWQ